MRNAHKQHSIFIRHIQLKRVVYSLSASLILSFFLCARPHTSSWKTYDTSNMPFQTNWIRQIILRDNELEWIGTFGDGLYHLSNDTWKKVPIPFPEKEYIFSLFTSSDSTLWIGTGNNGLIGYKNNIWVQFDTSNGLCHNNVWYIAEGTSHDSLWLCSRYNGLSILSYKISKQALCYKKHAKLPDNQITVAQQDSFGRVWIGTARSGVCTNSYPQGIHYHTKNGLSGNYIRALLCDTTLRWVGSWDGGLDFWNDSQWVHIPIIKKPVVYIVVAPDSTLWIGTWGNGAYYLSKKKWYAITSENSGLADNHVIDIKFSKNGSIFFATSKGISCWHK